MVVLPSVPVMPTTPRSCEGSSGSPRRSQAQRDLGVGGDQLRHGDRRAAAARRTTAAGPGRDRTGDVVVAVRVLPAPGHEEVAGRHLPGVVADRGDDRIGLAPVGGQRIGRQQAPSMQQRAEGREAMAQSPVGVAATGVSGSRPRRRRAMRTQARRPRW